MGWMIWPVRMKIEAAYHLSSYSPGTWVVAANKNQFCAKFKFKCFIHFYLNLD